MPYGRDFASRCEVLPNARRRGVSRGTILPSAHLFAHIILPSVDPVDAEVHQSIGSSVDSANVVAWGQHFRMPVHSPIFELGPQQGEKRSTNVNDDDDEPPLRPNTPPHGQPTPPLMASTAADHCIDLRLGPPRPPAVLVAAYALIDALFPSADDVDFVGCTLGWLVGIPHKSHPMAITRRPSLEWV